jgi:hypothetical protein
MENPIEMDDLGVPWGTPFFFGNLHVTGDKQPGEVFNIRGMGLFVIFNHRNGMITPMTFLFYRG